MLYTVLMGTAMRYTKQKPDAEDLFNRAFLKILDNLNKIPTDVVFEAWCKRILINLAIDDFRKQQKETDWLQFNGDIAADAQTQPLTNLEADDLRKLLQLLPNATQKVFNLFAIDGYSHAEISTQLGISEGTSKWHLSKAREQLKKLITNLSKKMLVL